jgi:hypothetical protein
MFPVFGAAPGSIQFLLSGRVEVIRSAAIFPCVTGLRIRDKQSGGKENEFPFIKGE